MPDQADLDGLIVGVDTRESVASAVGEPGIAGITDDSGWYYIRSEFRTYAYRAPEEVDREVLAISFNPEGTVTNIERFGLENGRVVALSRRVTDSNTQGISFLRQAFGNLGRITAGDLFN
jgi:outer membrane protein assembly factor BamE (lipoprotein component of BamABCDE complex)